ncbi:hydroxypyruvate isomerase family protein [Marinospirillum sp.]|uniref:hydroxypyruvate isomerase family protein n=1 Tax=Marinospirillum sp. TaxID=2183934 RepID=UPI00384D750E
MKLAANISLMFQELPLLERIAQAKKLGFQGIEVQFPYSESPDAWHEALQNTAMPLILLNLPAGDFMQGGLGLACHPDRQADFEEALEASLPYIKALQPRIVNVLAGRQVPGFSQAACLKQLVGNLQKVCSRLQSYDLKVTCEPINDLDQPGYLIPRVHHWQQIATRIAADNFALQLDLYHAARMQEDLIGLIHKHADQLAHIQFADCPGRSHPGSGDIDWCGLHTAVQQIRYSGWLAAEFPAQASDDFGWMSRLEE